MQAAHNTAFDMNVSDTLEISGRFDGTNAEDIIRDAKLRMQTGARNLTLDCSGLNYMTAGGMHALATIAKEMRERSGNFAVSSLRGQPKAMFDACGFNLIIPSIDIMSDAAFSAA